MTEDLRFFNPSAEVRVTTGPNLPHWQQQSVAYFVTYRLFDSVPASLLRRWKEDKETWMQVHPLPWSPDVETEYHRRFTGAIERWLDAGHGSCLLRKSGCAQKVMESLRHFDGEQIVLISAVVMPNHVECLFVLNGNYKLEKLLFSWKTFSAKRINKIIDRSGNVWQRDYFDRIIRDAKHFENCVRYIRRNPTKACLSNTDYLLYENQLAQAIE